MRCGFKHHDGAAERRAQHAGDVGENCATQPLLAGVGDGDDVGHAFAVRDELTGLAKAGLQIGRCGGREQVAAKRQARPDREVRSGRRQRPQLRRAGPASCAPRPRRRKPDRRKACRARARRMAIIPAARAAVMGRGAPGPGSRITPAVVAGLPVQTTPSVVRYHRAARFSLNEARISSAASWSIAAWRHGFRTQPRKRPVAAMRPRRLQRQRALVSSAIASGPFCRTASTIFRAGRFKLGCRHDLVHEPGCGALPRRQSARQAGERIAAHLMYALIASLSCGMMIAAVRPQRTSAIENTASSAAITTSHAVSSSGAAIKARALHQRDDRAAWRD